MLCLRLVLSVSVDHRLCKVPLQRITLSVTLTSSYIYNDNNNNNNNNNDEWDRRTDRWTKLQ